MSANRSPSEVAYRSLQELVERRRKLERESGARQLFTDYNFADIYGNNLLHYACHFGKELHATVVLCAGANIEAKVGASGLTPIEIALENGHQPIASMLFELGAFTTHIKAFRVHPSCRRWFDKKIPCDSMHRFIERNMVESFNQQFMSSVLTHAEKVALSQTAVENLNIDVINFLLNHDASLGLPMLFTAIQCRFHQVALHLLNKKVDINGVNSLSKKTSLMKAVEVMDSRMVDILLKAGANVTYQNAVGMNALHLSIKPNNTECIAILLASANSDKALKAVNCYGQKPIDMVIEEGNDSITKLFFPTEELYQRAKSITSYGKKPPVISQNRINRNLAYFLKLNNRDVGIFSSIGNCYGLSYLRNYYQSYGRLDYFYLTLTMIAGWDGSETVLSLEIPAKYPQSGYHKTYFSLFDQWVNDITSIQTFYQGSLDKIHEVTKPFFDNTCITTINEFSHEMPNMTIAQAAEHVDIFKRLSSSMFVMICGGRHAVGAHAEEGRLHYYDSNLPRHVHPQAVDGDLINFIVDTKYRPLGNLNIESLPFRYFIYHYTISSNSLCEQYACFTEEEFPKNRIEAYQYQVNSPSGYTHLHVAVMTGSIVALGRLLRDGHCDMNAKNAFNETVFNVARRNNRMEMLSMLLDKDSTCMPVGKILNMTARKSRKLDDSFLSTLMRYVTPGERVLSCISAIHAGNMDYVRFFLANYSRFLDCPTVSNETLLIVALKEKKYQIAQLIVDAGASILQSGAHDHESGYDTTPLEYVIDNKMLNCIPFMLARDASHLSLLVISLLRGVGTVELIEDAEFDLGNTVHYELLDLLLQVVTDRQDLLNALLAHADDELRSGFDWCKPGLLK